MLTGHECHVEKPVARNGPQPWRPFLPLDRVHAAPATHLRMKRPMQNRPGFDRNIGVDPLIGAMRGMRMLPDLAHGRLDILCP